MGGTPIAVYDEAAHHHRTSVQVPSGPSHARPGAADPNGMERTARVTRYVLCAALATVAFVSSTTTAAAAVKKAHRGRRVTCVVHTKRHGMKRHGKKSGRKFRRVVRCPTRRAKRRGEDALDGPGGPRHH